MEVLPKKNVENDVRALRFKIPTKELKSADTIWSTRPKTPEVAV